MTLRRTILAALISAAMLGSAAVAVAQQPGGMMGGQGAGPGMMGTPSAQTPDRGGAPATAPGPASGGVPCPGYPGGYGMGSRMMGGYGGYGMGPGMMGPGMMGGYGDYGMGPGMMANTPLYALDLSDDQRAKIIGIQRDLRNRMLDLGVKMTERPAKLIQFYGDETPDRKAIVSNYKALQDLQNEGLEARLDASEKVEAVLTKAQREQLRASGAGWMRP